MSFERAFPRAAIAAALLVAWLGAPHGAAAASPAERAAAREHLSQAEQLKKQGKLAEACKQLEEAERLDSKLPTLMELAECKEQAGDVVAAEQWWLRARDRAKKDEKPQSRARAEAHSHRHQLTWKRMTRIADRWLPPSRIQQRSQTNLPSHSLHPGALPPIAGHLRSAIG